MRRSLSLLAVATVLSAIFVEVAHDPAHAAGPSSAALAGQVTSQEEGPMEGVVVSAKKDGSTITVSVDSDKQGRYSFPSARLEPGHYTLKIRAVGYDLDSAGSVDLAAGQTTTADLKLRKTKNLALQLTNAEWGMSVPGTDQQRASFMTCNSCHTLQRIVRSTHDADEFAQLMSRMMSYAAGSQPLKPQRRMDPEHAGNPESFRKQAEYLASINLSASPEWEYSLKTLPRPSGRGTHVIVTEYDLPRPIVEPHDVIVDEHGTAWYTDFGEEYLGKLDPKTGKVTEFPLPELKPGYPQGSLDLGEDKSGNLWFGMMYQGALGKFDPGTEKFQIFPLPPAFNDLPYVQGVVQANMLGLQSAVDGKVWTNDAGKEVIYRLDLKTGKYEMLDPLKLLPSNERHSIYGIYSDSHNNLYFTEIQTGKIGRIAAKTKEVKYYDTPTPNSGPRRIYMDAQERLWIGEYKANRVAMLDTKTEKFTEWLMPTPWTAPYYVMTDKNGEAWTGGMNTDRVVRLDPKTGQSIEYLMPKDTNVRRVFVDNSTSPVTFWTGSNHGASIVKVEPLD
jgi:virginiamycin B lyase